MARCGRCNYLGANDVICLRSCDLATPGSPIRQTWISPRILIPSLNSRVTPPHKRRSSAFFTSAWPYISGAIDCASFPYMSGCWWWCQRLLICSADITISEYLFFVCVIAIASMYVLATRPACIACDLDVTTSSDVKKIYQVHLEPCKWFWKKDSSNIHDVSRPEGKAEIIMPIKSGMTNHLEIIFVNILRGSRPHCSRKIAFYM